MNVIDLGEPLDMVYRNTDTRYWSQNQPWQMAPRGMATRPTQSCVDPCLCVKPNGAAFYTPWGDPRWVRPLPNGGPIMTGSGEAFTPPGVGVTTSTNPKVTDIGGAKTHYIMPQPMLPITPKGPVQKAGVVIEDIGGGMNAEIPMPEGWIAAGPLTIQQGPDRFTINPLWLLGGLAALLFMSGRR